MKMFALKKDKHPEKRCSQERISSSPESSSEL